MNSRDKAKRLPVQNLESRESDQDFEEGEEHDVGDQSYGGKECGLCRDVPESIIYLSCDHIVCLVCAAKLILNTADIREIDFSEVICGICGETTELSKEVQETLIEFLNNGEYEDGDDQELENNEDEDEDEGQDDHEEEESDLDQDSNGHNSRIEGQHLGSSNTLNVEEQNKNLGTARENEHEESQDEEDGSVQYRDSEDSKIQSPVQNQSRNYQNKAGLVGNMGGDPKKNSNDRHFPAQNKSNGFKNSKQTSPINHDQHLSAKPSQPNPQTIQAPKMSGHKTPVQSDMTSAMNNTGAKTHVNSNQGQQSVPIKNAHAQSKSRTNSAINTSKNPMASEQANTRMSRVSRDRGINTQTQSRPVTEPESDDRDSSELALSFFCQKHINEEYSYYNPENKRLYCAQCLLTELTDKSELASIRPLKKCLPEILQNFQDMLNEVEVTRSLLENKRKDFEIRKESARAQCFSNYKKFELALDEFSEFIEELKGQGLKEYEARNEELFQNFESNQTRFDDKIAYFTAVIDQVTNLRQNSSTPEEEIFSFFFANQERISVALNEEDKERKDREYRDNSHLFDAFSTSVKLEQSKLLRSSLEALREKIDKALISLVPPQSHPSPRDHHNVRESQVERQVFNNSQHQFFSNQSVNRSLSNAVQTPGFSSKLPTQQIHTSMTGAPFPTQPSGRLIGANFFHEELAPNLRRLAERDYRAPDTITRHQTEFSKPQPVRFANSLDILKYSSTQGSNHSRVQNTPWEPENSYLANKISMGSYSNAISKPNYNLEKKMELERKLKLFDLKTRKDDSVHSSIHTVLNFNKKPVGGLSSLNGLYSSSKYVVEGLNRRERESNSRSNYRNASQISIK
jgi:hypothetical protein